MNEWHEIILLITNCCLWYMVGLSIGQDRAFDEIKKIIDKIGDELRNRQRTHKQLIY